MDLQEIIEHNGGRKVVANSTGIPYSSLNAILNGYLKLTGKRAVLLANRLDLSLKDLKSYMDENAKLLISEVSDD